MAVSSNRALIQLRGHIGSLIVVRYYAQADRIVLSAFPKMNSIVFSKAQCDNQNKFKRAVEFASKVRSSGILCLMFKQALGKEISVYKEAVKQYFKNPDSPLAFLIEIKMQGSSKDEPKITLPSCTQKQFEIAVKCLATCTGFLKTPKPTKATRRSNPNYRKYTSLMQGKLS